MEKATSGFCIYKIWVDVFYSFKKLKGSVIFRIQATREVFIKVEGEFEGAVKWKI